MDSKSTEQGDKAKYDPENPEQWCYCVYDDIFWGDIKDPVTGKDRTLWDARCREWYMKAVKKKDT